MPDRFLARIARFLPPVPVTLTFVLVYAIAFITANPLFSDPDAAWHIVAGDTVRRMGELPATNMWSFVTPDQKWYLISWLWDVMVSLIHSAGGTKAVFVFTQSLTALIMALLAWDMSKRGGINNAVIVVIAVLAGFCFHRFIMSRPQLAGYLFVALYHCWLHRSREDGSVARLLWLPFIMILWVNMHGSFPAGFALLGAYMLEAAWRRRWHWLRQLSITTALCLVVVPIANPYDFELYDAIMTSLHTVMNQHVEEWMPFRFGDYVGISLWLVLFIVLSNFRERAIPLADKFICIICLVPMLSSNRHASIFILVSAPYMAMNLQCVVNSIKWQLVLPRYTPRIEARTLRAGMVALAIVAIIVSVVRTDKLRSESYLIPPDFDSRPAIAWVREHLAGKRLLNDYNFGGMIIYQSGGTFPIFVDGRAGTAYPEKLLVEYENFEQFYKNWAAILDEYHIDAILVANYRPFAALYVNGAKYDAWELVYRDKVASVFVRK